jgi:cytochrome P450
MTELPVRPDDLMALVEILRAGNVADPYPAYRRWREERPVARPREELFVLSRFADCEAVLADPAFGRREDGDGRFAVAGGDPGVNTRSLLRLNPPDHTRLRRLVSRAFTPARVRALEPRIEATARELLDVARRADHGRCDLIEGLAQPLPVAVISDLLGIEPADRPRMVTWSAALARSLDPEFLIPEQERGRAVAARDEFVGYLRGLLPARRRAPGDDLISALIQASDEGGALTEDEVVSLCILLLVAGHETTRSLIGSIVLALLSHPAELTVLCAAPELTEQAVEETLRYYPPVQMLSRFALRSAQISGVTIPAGSFAVMLVGAANRDEAICSDPDSFRVTRRPGRHLAFGHGIHFCLGAPLARLEAAVALRLLLPMLPDLRVAAEPVWRPNTVLRGLEHLILEPVS